MSLSSIDRRSKAIDPQPNGKESETGRELLAIDLVQLWREEQRAPPVSASSIRFVVELSSSSSDSEVASSVRSQFELDVTVSALFPDSPKLSRFRLLQVAHVSKPDRADLFDLASSLKWALGAEAVEPDIGSNYFECDCERPHAGAPESADWAAWCWADPDKDKPSIPNWAIAKSRVSEAWLLSEEQGTAAKGEGILVFQPDTGVVTHHAELPAELHLNAGCANFVEEDTPPIDPLSSGMNPGHGTGTASVVASPEGGGMSGAAPRATLVPIRCTESVALFDQSRLARAIDHATNCGAHVITMSLGGVMSRAVHAAVKEAVRSNIIVVAAAGNCVGEVVWPARYPEVIAVGGTNEALKPWRGSCSGAAVDISGPAEFVARADAQHQSGQMAVGAGQGTSFATALTAGLAALWLAHHGRDRLLTLLPQGKTLQWLFRSMLLDTALTPPGFDQQRYGQGIIDALSLLEASPAAYARRPDAFPYKPGDVHTALLELVERAFGQHALESAGAALADKQHMQELACAALDRIRSGRTLRAHVESMPPPLLSSGLRQSLGKGASAFR